MATTRRDFLRQSGCALSAAALVSGIEHFGLVNALAQGQADAGDYKALVCIFLSGGNDGNNTIVPLDDYTAYNNVRGASGLAIPQANLLPITPIGGGRQFSLHPSLPELQSLFNQQRLAVVCNTGPLVQPMTKSQYLNTPSGRPYQLFSHSDQVTQWFTSISNTPAQTGWGGRMADTTGGLNGASTFPQIVSIAGVNVFATGKNTRPLAIASALTPLNQVLALTMTGASADVAARRVAFDQLRLIDNDATLVRSASDTTSVAVQTSDVLKSVTPPAMTFPNTSLGNQLKQVANVIALRDTLGVKRQLFFVSLGGFDHHNQQVNGQATLLTQVSQAMKAFYDATVELGVAPNVTTFTQSDFGRTFKPAAGGGSDHAWGSHHMIMGDAVRGGDFYGTYPTLALAGPDDSGNEGRWIPTASVDQYAATLATWYGLAPADLPTVFPSIGRFNSSNLGFMG